MHSATSSEGLWSVRIAVPYAPTGNTQIIKNSVHCIPSLQNVSWVLWGLELLGSLSGQLYYPVEHIAWAADLRLISTSSYHFWTMAVVLWGISLLVNCIQNILFLIKTSDHRHRKSKPESASTNNTNSGLESVRVQRHMAVLTVVESLCDVMNAVHWLPDGILWSGKLPLLWVGLFGSVSSLIGLYKISSKVNLE